MQILVLLILIAVGAYLLKSRDEKRCIALLGNHLGQYQIEKLMENLTEGYLRALGEEDPQRREQIWNLLHISEVQLAEQFTRFATEFATVDAAQARVSTLAIGLPYAAHWFPAATFDLRKVLSVHANGIVSVVANHAQRSIKDKAFTLTAELYLMQHSCHWFCKSRALASARLLARHKTTYEQVLAAVSPQTRQAYGTLVGV